MARREITQYFDDLDNSPLSPEEVKVVDFSFDGTDYTMELSAKNKEKFAEALAPFISVARRVPRSGGARRSGSTTSNAAKNRKIREWALKQNLEVSKRGRISAEIVDKYNKAHS